MITVRNGIITLHNSLIINANNIKTDTLKISKIPLKRPKI